MKGIILLGIVVIGAVIVGGGAAAYHFLNEAGVDVDDINSDTINDVVDKVSDAASSDSSSSDDSSDKSVVDKASDIVKEEVKFNAQDGHGHYREVTYADGGFRQYDVDTGELIGSSYDSDQDKLPSME